MGLKQDLTEMAERLKTACPEGECPDRAVIREIAAELRGMAKALPDDGKVWGGSHPMAEQGLTNDRLLRERVQAQDARRRAFQEEAEGCVMRGCVGGPADDTLAPTHPQMTAGASCMVAGCVYTLGEDGSLHAQVPQKKG